MAFAFPLIITGLFAPVFAAVHQ